MRKEIEEIILLFVFQIFKIKIKIINNFTLYVCDLTHSHDVNTLQNFDLYID